MRACLNMTKTTSQSLTLYRTDSKRDCAPKFCATLVETLFVNLANQIQRYPVEASTNFTKTRAKYGEIASDCKRAIERQAENEGYIRTSIPYIHTHVHAVQHKPIHTYAVLHRA